MAKRTEHTVRRRTIRVNDSPDAADARTLKARASAEASRRDGLARMVGERKADGWMNILTGIGDPRRDKRMASGVYVDRLTYEEEAVLYRSDDMAARIVDRPAKEMVRRGFEIHIENDSGDLDEEASDALESAIKRLEWKSRFFDALRYSRAYGGAGIFIGAVDKAASAAEPLNEEALEEVRFLTVLDRRELYPLSYYADPLSPSFGMPEFYRVQPAFTSLAPSLGSVAGAERLKPRDRDFLRALPVVHESRIIRFDGVIVNRWQQRETLGWGDSILQRVNDVLRDFQMSWHSAAYLVTDFSQAVATMKGISEAIENGDDKSVQARLLAIEMMRSVARMVVMDEGETFERKQTPISGLKELLDGFFTRLGSAAGMPVTVLAGESPAGLNATGASDIRNWYDQISSDQEWLLEPRIRRLVELIAKSKRGPTGGKVPEQIEIVFNPLWAPTANEEADRRLKVAQTDHIYITDQVVDPAEIGIARFGGPRYSSDLTIDVEARRAFLEEHPPGGEEQRAAAEAAAQGAQPGAGKGAPAEEDEGDDAGEGGEKKPPPQKGGRP